jgi:penicillin-binding protein 1B
MIRLTIRIGKSRARKKKRRKSKRSSRLGVALAVLIVLSVAAAAGLLHVYVSVTGRFDGRLWTLPSRIYSDVAVLQPRGALSAGAVAERLDRCGYARTAGRPEKPGQYRLGGGTLEIYLREFVSPVVEGPERRVSAEFAGGRLIALRDDRGVALARVALEPELLATLYGPRQEERRLVRMADLPVSFVDAVLAAEDSRFFEHHGLDLRGILRAGLANVRRGRIVQGGSTITQQTVKNLYLGQERTWWRKAREAVMALVLDARYPKERILEVYLNEVYLGQRGPVAICGVQAASRFYFGRDLGDLSLGERAVLAGLIRSPGRYNPFVHPGRARERRDQVLAAMVRLGTADAASAEAARHEPLGLASGSGGFSRASYAVDYVSARLRERFPSRVLAEEGLSIYTTIDTRLQLRAERVLHEGLERLDPPSPGGGATAELRGAGRYGELQGALVATRPSSGAILAMMGGRSYGQTQFNRAVQARRQPGSCFKPLVYAAAFEIARRDPGAGLTPASLLDDRPLELTSGGRTWRPSNYDGRFRGPVTARRALEESLNVPTVRAAQRIGLEAVIDVARRCGIESPLAAMPSLALGAMEVQPLELAAAYGVFARQGTRVTPWIIRAVLDADGRRLEGEAVVPRRAISPQAAFQVDDILQGVFQRGTARSAAALGFDGLAAGKTGTTDDTRDAWFAGYSGDLLALVWVGFDDNAKTGLTGATGALPIWVEFMKPDAAPAAARPPAGMVRVLICPETGMLARKKCPGAREEAFAAGSEPTARCPKHVGRVKRWWRKLLGKEE